MHHANKRRATAVLLATMALAACNDGATDPSPADDQLIRDLAVSAGDAIATEVGVFLGSEMTLHDGATSSVSVGSANASARRSENCTFDGGSGRFNCTVVTDRGLTITRSFALYDAGGNAQDHYDRHTTASADFHTTVTGTLERDGYTATVARSADATLSGLEGSETSRSWNGASSAEVSAEHVSDAGLRRYEKLATGTVSAVVVGVPRSENPWPISGSIAHHVTVTRTREGATDVSRTASRRVVVTFNGTQFVPLTVNDIAFTLDLATGKITRVE
ncbi:MAG: hypothetical protein ACRENI_10190 [Gemmatimonadaceae bacterium]